MVYRKDVKRVGHKEKFFFFFSFYYIYVRWLMLIKPPVVIIMYVNQTIMLYSLNLYSEVCQFISQWNWKKYPRGERILFWYSTTVIVVSATYEHCYTTQTVPGQFNRWNLSWDSLVSLSCCPRDNSAPYWE